MLKHWTRYLILVGATVLVPAGSLILLEPSQGLAQEVLVSQSTEGSVSTCDGATALTEAEINDILQVHNQARADVGVPPLTWNCTLAEAAQAWADRDVWEHSSADARQNIIPNSYVGENLAAAAGADRTLADWGARDWYGEIADWDNASGTCAEGKVCGHYTQMVWRNTTEIGCGINRNSSVMGDEWANNSLYLVCNYNPGGNYGGERPY